MTNDKPTLRIEARHYSGDFLEIDLRETTVKILVDSTRISKNSEYILLTNAQFAEAMATLGYVPKPAPTFAEKLDALGEGSIIAYPSTPLGVYVKMNEEWYHAVSARAWPSDSFFEEVEIIREVSK